jgi:hypothetical protein
MWKKRGKKSNSNDRRKKNILRKPIDQMTQTSKTIKFCAGSIQKHKARTLREERNRTGPSAIVF